MPPRQNRVTPLGELIAVPARGLVYGNRGCLHDAAGRIRRHHQGRRWIACRLEFRGRRRTPLMQPGRYTELFFLDDATALAAGHRPCAECRRADYDRLLALWRDLHGGPANADAIDARLHAERTGRAREARLDRRPDDGTGGRPHVRLDDLPDGVFVVHAGAPHVVLGDHLLRWTPAGYDAAMPRPAAAAPITPPSLVELLRTGPQPLVPLIHPSADRLRA